MLIFLPWDASSGLYCSCLQFLFVFRSFCLQFCLCNWKAALLGEIRWLTWPLKNIPFSGLEKMLSCSNNKFGVIIHLHCPIGFAKFCLAEGIDLYSTEFLLILSSAVLSLIKTSGHWFPPGTPTGPFHNIHNIHLHRVLPTLWYASVHDLLCSSPGCSLPIILVKVHLCFLCQKNNILWTERGFFAWF